MEQQPPKVISDCHLLLEWLIPQLDKFPRLRRYTLGERIESGMLAVLENLIEAAYSRTKAEPLKRANLKLDLVRHLWRLSFRLQAVPAKRYEHGARLLHALGRQIGGWSRQQQREQGGSR
ncbi:diversity-generating retroelement protein Avd [Candidatus Thiosymbion oneisti]|uniref:diversity-generating retroelement protein Avd n=1 Tax=Candidatus Thiosymbion oneisti TaxID=589554 RepID=UPI000B7F35EC|nr:diversity-generating retroelement protein Avd [Candidatus Thiosymbion oneisti]